MWKKFLHIFKGTPSKYEYSPKKSPRTPTNTSFGDDTIILDLRHEELEFKPKSKILSGEKIVFQDEDTSDSSGGEYLDSDIQNVPLPFLKFPDNVSESGDVYDNPNKLRKLNINFKSYDLTDYENDDEIKKLPDDIENYKLESDVPLPYFKKDYDTPVLEKKTKEKENQFNKYELKGLENDDETKNNKTIRFGELKDKNEELKPKTSILKTNPFTLSDSDSDDIPIIKETKHLNIEQLSPKEKNNNNESNNLTPKMISFKPMKINSSEKNDNVLLFDYDSDNEQNKNFEKFPLKNKNNKSNKNKIQLSLDSYDEDDSPKPIYSSFLNKKNDDENNQKEKKKGLQIRSNYFQKF